MLHSIEQLSERFSEQMTDAVAVNLASINFYNTHVEMYKISSSSLDFDVVVANNMIQISGTYGTYVFGSFSNPLLAIEKLSDYEVDPHTFIPYLMASDTSRGAIVFDFKLAQALLQEQLLEQIHTKVYSTLGDFPDVDIIFDEVQEYILDDVLDSLYHEGRGVESKQEFIDVLSSSPVSFNYSRILSEEILDRMGPIPPQDQLINITFEDFGWLDAEIISYHFVMNVLVLIWLAKIHNNR